MSWPQVEVSRESISQRKNATGICRSFQSRFSGKVGIRYPCRIEIFFHLVDFGRVPSFFSILKNIPCSVEVIAGIRAILVEIVKQYYSDI